jgi:hypothetical protein
LVTVTDCHAHHERTNDGCQWPSQIIE